MQAAARKRPRISYRDLRGRVSRKDAPLHVADDQRSARGSRATTSTRAPDGEGASAQIDGLALIGERQLADTHTSIDHAKPNGRSAQLHKCIVGGAAHAVFNGKILVRPGAQLTDSAQ